MSRVGVIGAGLAGLAAATHLRDRHEVVVLERAAQPGGKIHSQHIDGFLFEWGPNGFLSNAAELRALVHEAGLDDALTEADPRAARRSVFWRGKLHELPAKPPRALGMSLLSPRAKVRALAELLVPPKPAGPGVAESVSAFITRRFGREVAERIVAPALLGISGGDAAATSVDALFPRLREMERDHRSVIRALLRGSRTAGRLTGFGPAGMQRLTDRLAENLGAALQLECAVERIEPLASGWRIVSGHAQTEVDAIVATTPAYVTAQLTEHFDPTLAAQLRRIAYAPMRVVGVAFRAADVPVPLDGFGFLVARGQDVRILGALYTSTIYPAQAPAATAYLRVFLGGQTDPEAALLEPRAARAVVLTDLHTTLGIQAEPLAFHETIWPQAIPQYALDHADKLDAIDTRLALHPGLHLAGNAYRGLGVSDTTREAQKTAANIF